MQKRINTRFDERAELFISRTNIALEITAAEQEDMKLHPEKYEPLRPARRFKKRLRNIAENMGRMAADEVRKLKKLSIDEKRHQMLKPFSTPFYARNSR